MVRVRTPSFQRQPVTSVACCHAPPERNRKAPVSPPAVARTGVPAFGAQGEVAVGGNADGVAGGLPGGRYGQGEVVRGFGHLRPRGRSGLRRLGQGFRAERGESQGQGGGKYGAESAGLCTHCCPPAGRGWESLMSDARSCSFAHILLQENSSVNDAVLDSQGAQQAGGAAVDGRARCSRHEPRAAGPVLGRP